MKTIKIITLLVVILVSPSTLLAQAGKKQSIKVNADIKLIKIKDSFYVHTSWFDFPGAGRYPSNGLIYVKDGKALLIDTPVTNQQTKQLVDFLKNEIKVDVTKVIVGHYHEDCLGGLGYLHSQGIPSISNELTKKKCIELDLPVPTQTFKNQMISDFEGEKVICQYFGGGHTIDNIVVFFPDKKVLFGGCLIRSLESKGLGNTKDAVINDWNITVQKIIDEYKEIDIVVPGHGSYGNSILLTHTIDLVQKYKRR